MAAEAAGRQRGTDLRARCDRGEGPVVAARAFAEQNEERIGVGAVGSRSQSARSHFKGSSKDTERNRFVHETPTGTMHAYQAPGTVRVSRGEHGALRVMPSGAKDLALDSA